MDLQEFIDLSIRVARSKSFANSVQITLGQMIDEFESIELFDRENKPKCVIFDFGAAVPTTLDSWRGSYAELALGYADYSLNDDLSWDSVKADKFLKHLKSAVGKTFEGYKGGEFKMNRETPVWVSNYGISGSTGVIGVVDIEYAIVIMTAYCDY